MNESELARKIKRYINDRPGVALRQVVIQSVDTNGHLTLDVQGDAEHVRHLRSYVPVEGDTVWALQDGPMFLVLGCVCPGTYFGPLGELDYADAAANQGSITSETAITDVSVSVELTASRKLRIYGNVGFQSSVANDRVIMRVYHNGTLIPSSVTDWCSVANQARRMAYIVRHIPAAGAHTYHMTLERVNGTGTITMISNASNRTWMAVEDIGPG